MSKVGDYWNRRLRPDEDFSATPEGGRLLDQATQADERRLKAEMERVRISAEMASSIARVEKEMELQKRLLEKLMSPLKSEKDGDNSKTNTERLRREILEEPGENQ